jgi:WXG100 family type VII secretion target
MGIMLGGELGTMDNLSREFSKQIQTVDSLVSAIDAQVNNVQWTGKVSNDFRSAWHGEFKNDLKALQTALQQCSTHVRNRRDAIDQVTNV